ncbi:sulfate adenylyltransferase subunit 1 [Paucibacter oligotrophus]|uniref:sulfate adenylyltransferase n=1 Tax=Roseateles oligotrophus TaxID=1769250 RepID=A0A840LAB9_9BURK|nr:GTP-binding protein [Roseateles oligotrophus]MBB4842317.1 sulfate adenylyltransferase subunit 1 [Roseateles oligotrophus]
MNTALNTVIHDTDVDTHHRALRFLTAGSVDDGKSTLIGRLLFDSRAILADQLDVLAKRAAGEPIDLSLLTDGLEAEREQGITIDVAYRYFATKTRKFIIADAPGHEQYTRNMVTAAAGSDAAVVLVDITKLDTSVDAVELLPQTRRHSLLAHLLRVPSIVFAVNKLDAVAQPGPAFAAVSKALRAFAAQAGIEITAIVPVSALRGDNVTQPLAADWYSGPSLLQVLESLPGVQEKVEGQLLIPVQYVAKDGEGTGHQARTLWGRIAHGQVQAGDEVQILPSGQTAQVAEVRRAGETVAHCVAGESAGVVLDRQLDVSRGDWIVTPGSAQPRQSFEATLAWLDTEPAVPGRKYWLRHGNRWVQARISAIQHRLDIHSLQEQEATQLNVNEIGHVLIETQSPLPVEPYTSNRVGGSLIVVDPTSNRSSGALLVR